jgi:glycosyltransferase involved in cell wall biosynthesis
VEGFGRVFVEACSSGLVCVVHDFPVARELLGRWGTYVDMRDPRALTEELARALASAPRRRESVDAQRREMTERFDWSSLRDRYVTMFQRAAAESRPVAETTESHGRSLGTSRKPH